MYDDYGHDEYQNEYQAAYAVSQRETPFHKADEREIDRLIRNGLYVVIVEALRYCPITDATLSGSNTAIDSAHPTREAAYRRVEEIHDDVDGIRII